MIKGVAFFAMPASDPKRAGKFYRDIIGLKTGQWDVEAWVEVETPCGCTVALEQVEHPYLALETDDIYAEVARLRSLGVEITQDVRPAPSEDADPWCRSAWVRDSEGNKVMIHQLKPEQGW